jgi:hypothetical protein
VIGRDRIGPAPFDHPSLDLPGRSPLDPDYFRGMTGKSHMIVRATGFLAAQA